MRYPFLLGIYFLFCVNSYAQNSESSKPPVKQFDLEALFETRLGSASVNGIIGVYEPMSATYQGESPFFKDGVWLKSTLVYRGKRYDEIEMMYDLKKDILFIRHPKTLEPVMLEQSLVDSFTMAGYTFNWLDVEKPGFFEVLYSKNSYSLLKKHEKQEIIGNGRMKYLMGDRYYLSSIKDLERIKSVKFFYRLFSEHKSEIRGFYRKSVKKKFKEEPGEAYVLLFQFCQQFLQEVT